jgi:hypothetical protein
VREDGMKIETEKENVWSIILAGGDGVFGRFPVMKES